MVSEDCLSFLKNKFNEDILNKKLKDIINEYNGLINIDTAIKILAKQNEFCFSEKQRIADIKKGMRSINLDAEIIKFFPIYERKGDNSFKCQRIMLKDETGTIPLVFWNEDIQKLENELSLGDKIELSDAYENNGELNYTYRTKFNIIEKQEPISISDLKEGICSVKGRIVEIFPEYLYKKNGEIKKMASFKLMQGKEQIRVIIWENLKFYDSFDEGDLIRIESGWFKNGEIHLNEQARVIILEKVKDSDVIKGEIKDIKLQLDELVVLVADKLLFLKLDQIPSLFKMSSISNDIKIETLLELKKDFLKNNEFSFTTFKQEGKVYGEVLI